LESDLAFKTVTANGVRLRLAVQGSGPLVILCHGWPESWYSWRHQIPVIADAGYTVVAYDVRGYGESDKPQEIEAYTLKELAGDVLGIADALGFERFITIGHDWGGPIALTTALLYPERVYATGSLSVPHLTRPPLPTLDLWRAIYKDRFFYQLYFLNEGMAEAEFEADLATSLFLVYTAIDARGMKHQQQNKQGGFMGLKAADAKLLDNMTHFETFPNWFSQTDLDYLVSQFQLSGKRGPYNRYRAQNLDWEELAHLNGAKISQPAFFITGELDPVSSFVPLSTSFIEHVKKNYENLLIAKELSNVGHWTAEEAPRDVNETILAFLARVHDCD
jgi:pimeloyl-ACP methyl ester carboxylesterase